MADNSSAQELATRIVAQLQAAGHVAYFAGGCVRDCLMGRTPADYDVATSAKPDEVTALFPRSQQVGAAFGVILVRERKTQVEVATFRTDGHYHDGRHPEQVTFSTAQEDAQRRDFTCNGIFYDPLADQLHDFVGGQTDIAAKTLRAIGDPAQRFAEDQLRMLRAVRFAAKLGFQIEPRTFAAIRKFAPRLTTVSRERIGDEIRMILEHPTRTAAATLLADTHLLDILWPADLRGPQPPQTWPTLGALPEYASPVTGLVALQLDLYLPAAHIAPGLAGGNAAASTTPDLWTRAAPALRECLMLSNQETSALLWLGHHQQVLRNWPQLTKAAFKRMIADPRWPELAALYHAIAPDQRDAFDRRSAELERQGAAPIPFITGEDLIALGARPGKQFKSWLEQLYDLQLEGELTSKDAALTKARALIQNAH